MRMIAIIDYDAGNIKSVEKALKYLGEDAVIMPQQFQHSAPCSAKHHGHHRSTKR